ncbi:MAG: heat-inducible transcriptional repressor HrcA [Candidatus Bipolaricaulia bacterium]
MNLDNRKRLILKEIVDRYIRVKEPVSSRMILDDYQLSVSSATVRNDMKHLKKLGYIDKPYPSSGRIPTEKGYRFFVDWLLELAELNQQEKQAIVESYRFQRQEINRLFQQTVFLLANISGYVGFLLSPALEHTYLQSVTMTGLDRENILVVIVSDIGIVESKIIRADIPPDELEKINHLLNRRLRGERLSAIQERVVVDFEDGTRDWYDKVIGDALLLVKEMISDQPDRRLYIEGILNLLRHPDVERIEDVREVIGLLEDERRFTEMIRQIRERPGRDGIVIAIAEESGRPELTRYSLITADYGGGFGVVGVLGPMRMDYSKAVATTRYIANRLSTILARSSPSATEVSERR